ncbi:craniofacial development protein 2-like [Artemia franciscana]|uniref:craniofacial development protein 2-like n=1 Tax=Artemia franciscana TaxID=6661 RepID=UPI0032D9B167
MTCVVAVYAPTNKSSDSDKDTFYQSLSDVTNKVHSHDILVVCGDFNAKVGCHQDNAPTVIGSHGLGEIRENGMRLIDCCVTNDMIVGVTWLTALSLDDSDETSSECLWKSVSECLKDAAAEVLGYKKRKKEEWVSEGSWQLIQERKNLKTLVDKYSPSHSSSHPSNRQCYDSLKQNDKFDHKQVKMSARNDKRTYAENIATKAERALGWGDSKTIYMLTKKLSGAKTNPYPFVEDISGSP